MQHLAEGATHEDALAALLRWLEVHFRDDQLVAAGHRVVHGGSLYTAPVLIDASVIAALQPPHSAGAAASTSQPGRHRGHLKTSSAICRRSPASTRLFIIRNPRSPRHSRCRAGWPPTASGATGFTAFPMNTSPAFCPTSLVRQPPTVAWSSPISAAAQACARSAGARAWRRPWVLRRSMACP